MTNPISENKCCDECRITKEIKYTFDENEQITDKKKEKTRNKTWHSFSLAARERQFEEVIGNIYENPELLAASH